jgi:uncharacterized protein
LIAVLVKPRSKTAGITVEGDSVVVRIREPAVEGAANSACVAALADDLAIPPSHVTIVRGARSRRKQLAVEGLTAAEVRDRLRKR